MPMADTIAAKLKSGLNPSFIEVKDVSHQHAGHAGWREGGETHFHVTITAEAFEGKSRLQRCLLYTSPSPRDRQKSRMPSSA